MGEYIEREKVYHKLTGVCDGYCHAKMCKFTEYMLEEIEDIPAVDLQPVNSWFKTSENLDKLQDHYYYLVTHPAYKTPIKAKYHDDIGGYFEFPYYPVPNEFTDPILGECKIKYFMELPEMPDDYEEVDSVD